jgi:hypothetical protein
MSLPSTSELWVCDIVESAQECDNDFLFYAKLEWNGSAQLTCRRICIFQSISYDINEFVEDTTPDGFVELCLVFGKNTVERAENPGGWKIAFKVRHVTDYRYAGQIWTSWLGVRDVVLLRYDHLSVFEQRRYPDLNAKHYRSVCEVHKSKRPAEHTRTDHSDTSVLGDVARGFAGAAATAFVGGLFDYVMNTDA